jgi:murein DD-endopeptidase MepM/ murein hydrolase activator NlpD
MVLLALAALVSLRSALPGPGRSTSVVRVPRAFAAVVPLPVLAAAEPAPTTTSTVVPIVWVRPAPGRITAPFHEARRGHAHLGTDIDGETGDAVRAAAPGIVVVAGAGAPGYSGYGNVVVIAHGHGLTTLYAHLSRVDVHAGQGVVAGLVVGAMGCSGSCTGSHLHFEVRVNDVAVDPMRFLPAA